MNSFSNSRIKSALLLFFLLTWGHSAMAIVITGIYTGACNRRLGVILGVNTYSLKFLGLDGKVENLPRHQVIQMVSYVTDEIPFTTSQIAKISPDEVPAFHISTLKNLSEHPLVVGYPIAFTDEKIAFLTQSGREVLIDKKSILRIGNDKDFILEPKPLKRALPTFGHAYAFSQCDKDSKPGPTLINPSQILAEPLTIKRDLDRLQKGYELVTRYMDEQDFYPQPMVYPSQTRLGMWYSFGSRYGASGSRTNNFSPVLNSGYVSDIYDFQRIIVTGSQPNFLFEHEEAQTQVYYAFKASYFHFAAYMDPSLMLIGENAEWSAPDLLSQDIKLFSKNGLGFGFDRNNWQIGFMMGSVNLALQATPGFFGDNVSLTKFRLAWSDFSQKYELLVGGGKTEDFSSIKFNNLQMKHLRLNYSRALTERLHTGFSWIENSAQMEQRTQSSRIDAKAQSFSVLAQYTFSKRFSVDSLLSVEKLSTEDSAGRDSSKTYLKGGTSLHLFF